jgi:hypothetical protein
MATDAVRGERALVVANEAVSGEELRHSLISHLGDRRGPVFVVAPALATSALHHYMGDVDDAIGPARERLDRTLAELRKAGIEADGEVGDADPMQAIADEIEKFHPDRVLLVAHRDEEGAFAEQGLLAQAQRDLELPVTELVVERSERAPHVLDVKETSGARPGRGRGWRPSGNWPPLSTLDVAGIVVAIVGTIVLALLAADCAAGEDGEISGACAARILIAIGLALVNLAHVVGLLLFQSAGYEGLFSRFFARMSLIGTPTAIVVSLLLGLAI